MAISLTKGGNISLAKEAPGMTKVHVGLGWDARVTDGDAFDVDASCFLLKEDGKVRGEGDFIFYNQKESPCGGVKHMGDNRTGEGEGDDEVVKIDLEKITPDVNKVTFTVTIHEAETRRQNFGMISKAYIRIVNDANNEEIARFDLSEDASVNTAMVFGELYRNGAEWKFRAVGQGFEGGLAAMARSLGLSV